MASGQWPVKKWISGQCAVASTCVGALAYWRLATDHCFRPLGLLAFAFTLTLWLRSGLCRLLGLVFRCSLLLRLRCRLSRLWLYAWLRLRSRLRLHARLRLRSRLRLHAWLRLRLHAWLRLRLHTRLRLRSRSRARRFRSYPRLRSYPRRLNTR